MERLFVLKTLSGTQRATKICGNLPETTAFKSNAANQYSDLPRSAFSQRSPTIVDNIRPCPKRCLLMPLTRVVARTESTTLPTREVVWRYARLHARCGQFPRTRIGTVQSNTQYTPRVLHFIRFFLRVLKLAIFFEFAKIRQI